MTNYLELATAPRHLSTYRGNTSRLSPPRHFPRASRSPIMECRSHMRASNFANGLRWSVLLSSVSRSGSLLSCINKPPCTLLWAEKDINKYIIRHLGAVSCFSAHISLARPHLAGVGRSHLQISRLGDIEARTPRRTGSCSPANSTFEMRNPGDVCFELTAGMDVFIQISPGCS